MTSTAHFDVLVIGAGQAGLAAGYHLRSTGLNFLILDCAARLGNSWRQRYDSLVLFTPRAFSALPGWLMSGDPAGCPSKDEQADYLEQYAGHFRLPIQLSTPIRRLTREASGFRAETEPGACLRARAVILATGAFQAPVIPPMAHDFAPEVTQLTPLTYQRPGQIAAGAAVIVVGDGATGRQMALELAAEHPVTLAASGRPEPWPERLLGRHLFQWFAWLGLLNVPRDSALGRRLQRNDRFPGAHLRLRHLSRHGVQIRGRLARAEGRRAVFADGSMQPAAAVIWATGYRDRTEWVLIPEAVDAAGAFRHTRGRSPVPGLYFVGRPWQTSQGSARLYGVGADAAQISRQAAAWLAQTA